MIPLGEQAIKTLVGLGFQRGAVAGGTGRFHDTTHQLLQLAGSQHPGKVCRFRASLAGDANHLAEELGRGIVLLAARTADRAGSPLTSLILWTAGQ